MNENATKKIRMDFYHYRVKKGRVDILLEHGEEDGTYVIPFHYVTEDERMDRAHFSSWDIEDDGDLVLVYHSVNDSHRFLRMSSM